MLRKISFAASLVLLVACSACVHTRATKSAAPANSSVASFEDAKVGDFVLGVQAYTFNHFTVFEAIERTHQAGAPTIEFYPGQKLSPDQPDVKWDHNVSDEIIGKVKAKLAEEHVRAVNYGVVRVKSAQEWRKVFEFAKKLGVYGITIEAVEDLDAVEPLVKEFNICVGIHEHARRAKEPNYKVWDPSYVMAMVKDRDPRIGACADTGHWATSGIRPLDAIKILKGRIISCHLKDRPVIGEERADVVLGAGVSDVDGMLTELKRQNFHGHISLEYENNWDHSVPDVAQCVGYVRGWSAAHK